MTAQVQITILVEDGRTNEDDWFLGRMPSLAGEAGNVWGTDK